MKQARQASLSSLEALLAKLRLIPGLVERSSGIFYVKSKAYLHFHEDPTGIFGDVKLGGDEFERFPFNPKREKESFLGLVVKNRSA